MLAMILFFASCDKKKDKETTDPEIADGNYFSINQYIIDQWNTFAGEPFVIEKVTWINGKTADSSLTNSDTLNWGRIFEIFSATDISDRKYLGQYTFNQFDDKDDGTHNFFYMAKEPDMFTQKVLITVDQFNMKVKGIYIETYKKSATDECVQKLFYSPMQKIQLQWDDRPLFGSKKHTVQEYVFMR